MRASCKASAAGKLMLLGEHAVLHGKMALVCAVNTRVAVQLKRRQDTKITLSSELGHFSTDLHRLEMRPPFEFVLSTIAHHHEILDSGLDVEISSEFSSEVGLGSSAAVVAATSAALLVLCEGEVVEQSVFENGLQIIRSVQGTGSGADLAASVFGGILAYRAQPLDIEKLPHRYPITVVYSGSKTPTTEVIKKVEESRQRHVEIFVNIYEAMDKSTQEAVTAIRNQDWRTFGQILNINQGLMDAIGVSNQKLAEICHALRQQPGILGAKISGSGLGDCVVGLGEMRRSGFPYSVLPVEISSEGIIVE